MSPPSTSAPKRECSGDLDWQSAQERVLLYLRLLSVPSVEALEIALEVFHRATSDLKDKDEHPVPAAMRILHNVLEERKTAGGAPRGESLFQMICPWPLLLEEAGVTRETRSMPPLQRGVMIPDRL